MPLSMKGHGAYHSRVLFKEKYHSIQASLSPTTTSTFRPAGHVTGLLFRSDAQKAYPDLLGQWTGPGPSYILGEAEQILGLIVETAKPGRRLLRRPPLSQVTNISVVTNLRKIHLGGEIGREEPIGRSLNENRIVEAHWEFNALFDRVRCVYK